jgi:alpha-1,6-mannosyltransferase
MLNFFVSSLRRNSRLLLAGIAIEAALLYLVYLGDLRTQIPLFWCGTFAAFAFYLLAAFLVHGRSTGSLRLILLLALAFRLTMWWSPPTLSEDIYRYVWDGRVQMAGINPYRHPPDAAELAPLRDALYPGINHKEIPTIYPPLTQLFFRLVYTLQSGLGMMKFALLMVEYGIVLLLVKILLQQHQDPRRVVLYAWNPLPPIEIAGSGHSDALGVFFLLLALYGLVAARKTAAVWALSAAFLSKLLPVLALPVFWRRMGGHPFHPRGRWPLLWFPVLGALGFFLFAGTGIQLFTGLQTYLLKWRFNDALFSLVYENIKNPDLGWDDAALLLTRQIFTGILLLTALWATLRYENPYRAVFVVMGMYLVLSPTLHPWYLLWVLPFLPLFPQPAWVLLSGLIFLAYEVLIGYSMNGIWAEQDWVKWAQYGPFYLLLALAPLQQRWRRHHDHKSKS